MPKTISEEIGSFANYARHHSPEVESLDVLYRRWREQAEREDVVTAIEQDERDAATGLGRKASDVFAELRQERGFRG